jgi:putative oxidoreductase
MPANEEARSFSFPLTLPLTWRTLHSVSRPDADRHILKDEKEGSVNLALWIAQGILAFVFTSIGTMKVFAYDKYKALSEKNGPTGITRGLAGFIGSAELAGALGIVLPLATHIIPWLSPLAAAGLATIMLLAIGFHLRRHESPAAPGILFLLAAFVTWGRFSHWA